MKGWNKEDLGVDSVVSSGAAAFLCSRSYPYLAWRGRWRGREQVGSRGKESKHWHRGSDLWSAWFPSISTCALTSWGASAWNRLWTMPPLFAIEGCHVRIPSNTRHQTEEPSWRGCSSSNTSVHRVFSILIEWRSWSNTFLFAPISNEASVHGRV